MSSPTLLAPPIKFSKIEPTLFRGAYPRTINYRYLKTLKLRTMIALVPYEISEESDPGLIAFCNEQKIELIHVETDKDAKNKGKKRSIPVDQAQVLKVLELVLDKRNSPVYLFCNNGGQATSLVVACLRKLQFWSSISIYNEFTYFSSTINHNDRTFIENFRAQLKLPSANHRVGWIWNGISTNVIETHPNLQYASFDNDTQESLTTPK